MLRRNHYVVLGVSRGASPANIRAAYHELARRTHPDINGPASTSRFREINEAYTVLSDPSRRRAHDRELDELSRETEVPIRRPSFSWPVSPEPIVFGQPEETRPSFSAFQERDLRNFTGWGAAKAERAESLTLDVALSPAEAFYGCTVPVGVAVFSACPMCNGTGQVFPFRCMGCGGSGGFEEQRTLRVRVPPRVRSGMVLEVPREMSGIGNLHLRLQVSLSDTI